MADQGSETSTLSQIQEKGSFRLSSVEAFGIKQSVKTFGIKSSPEASGGKPGHQWKKKPKSVAVVADEDLTPEEVHDIRYAGTQLEITCDDSDNDVRDPAKAALLRHRVANDAAADAFKTHNYKVLMLQEVGERLATVQKFDDLGSEVFVVMHTMKAFLGRRADYAPIELTAVRVRLVCGVEKDICHIFPSPLPMPYGKSADYSAGQKEFHEIDENEFKRFDDDYVNVFYNLLVAMNPQYPPRNVLGRTPKMPLVICKSYTLQSTVMAFEYLRQRALTAQKERLPTEAPPTFLVPEKFNMTFCSMDFFDMAFRAKLRAERLNCQPNAEIIDESLLNLCDYHQTTNKLTCTTYVVCELLERLLVFTQYFSGDLPARFVEPFSLQGILENGRLDYSQDSVSPLSTEQDRVRYPSTNSAMRGPPARSNEPEEESERGSVVNEPVSPVRVEPRIRKAFAFSPGPSSGKVLASRSGGVRSVFTTSSSAPSVGASIHAKPIGPSFHNRSLAQEPPSDKPSLDKDLTDELPRWPPPDGKGIVSQTPSPTPAEFGQETGKAGMSRRAGRRS